MSTLKFTADHEWLLHEGDGRIRIGISDYAQEQLGDVVFIELPAVGQKVGRGELLVSIESVKAVGEVNAPLTGTVVAINLRLADEPELVNRDPHGAGWLACLEGTKIDMLDACMDETAYREHLESL